MRAPSPLVSTETEGGRSWVAGRGPGEEGRGVCVWAYSLDVLPMCDGNVMDLSSVGVGVCHHLVYVVPA